MRKETGKGLANVIDVSSAGECVLGKRVVFTQMIEEVQSGLWVCVLQAVTC